MTDSHDPHQDLHQRLRRLGEQAESSVAATTVDDIVGLHIACEQPSARRRAPLILGAAALLAIIMAGSALVQRSPGDRTAELATHTQPTAIPDGSNPHVSAPDDSVFDDNGWEKLRWCEATGQYDIDAGNSFYGAYQLTRDTWRLLGDGLGLDWLPSSPADAAPYVQDALAAELYQRSGAQPWPICGDMVIGPMRNPLIPSWLHPDDQRESVIVFANPETDDDGLAVLRRRLVELDWVQGEIQFVSKAQAYDDFRTQFRDNSALAERVTVSDMPPSFQFLIAPQRLDQAAVAQLEDWPNVFKALSGPAHRAMQITIDALGIDATTSADWTVAALREQIAALAPLGMPANFSQPGIHVPFPDHGPLVFASARPDWQLDQLNEGDVISIEAPFEQRRSLTIRQRLTVSGQPESVLYAEIADPSTYAEAAAVLLAPDPEDADRRIVVVASFAPESQS